jgi:hypothetical protein
LCPSALQTFILLVCLIEPLHQNVCLTLASLSGPRLVLLRCGLCWSSWTITTGLGLEIHCLVAMSTEPYITTGSQRSFILARISPRSGRCPRPQKSALIRNLLIRSTLHPRLGSRRLLHPIELELLLSRYRTILTSKALRGVLWTYSLFEQAFLVIPPSCNLPL